MSGKSSTGRFGRKLTRYQGMHIRMSAILYFTWATLLLICNLAALLANLFSLPGNWLMVIATAVFAVAVSAEDGRGISLSTVGVLLVLAILGEVLEFVAGAAGAARQGGSRRAMALSLSGTMIGSICGAVVAAPIPVVGPIIGALGGGALGAFTGAYLGEMWKGTDTDQRVRVSQAAMWGRLLGTFGKLSVGAIICVIATIDAFV